MAAEPTEEEAATEASDAPTLTGPKELRDALARAKGEVGEYREFARRVALDKLGVPEESWESVGYEIDRRGVDWREADTVQLAMEEAGMSALMKAPDTEAADRSEQQAAFIRATVMDKIGVPEEARDTIRSLVEQGEADWTDAESVQGAIAAAGLSALLNPSRFENRMTPEARERLDAQSRMDEMRSYGAVPKHGPGSLADQAADAEARGDVEGAMRLKSAQMLKAAGIK